VLECPNSSFGIAKQRRQNLSVDELKQEEEARKSIIALGKRLLAVRVSYALVVSLVCWFALVLVLYFMRLLGFIDGR
jgi:hypothetical protein